MSSTIHRLCFLLTVSYFLLGTCNGSENSASSFQSPPPPPPPPPPPGSSFSAQQPATNEYGEEYQVYDDYPGGQQQQEMPPPPPIQDNYGPDSQQQVPQQQSEGPSLPIHYEFPVADDDFRDEGERRRPRDSEGDGDRDRDLPSATSSARRDLVTQYWSSKMGKAQIQTVVGLVGYGSGSFVAKSVVGGSDLVRYTGYFWAIFMIVSTWFRTPMGELSRAIGLSLILVLQRTQRIRREYPTWRYVAASVGILRGGPRDARGRPRGPRPFPPARNPWRYTPRSPRDPDFNMIYTLVSMAMVGSTVGGNMPFIPNWIGAVVGAATFAFACTWQNSHRGDLARTMGMRVVRAVTELWEIQADLQIIPKATVVSSQVIDKAMILDRKHRVKDRFLSFANKGYAQASKVAEQIQKQQRGGNDERSDRNDRDRRGRRDGEAGDSERGREQDRDRRRGSRDREEDSERDRDWRRDRRNRGRDREEDSDREDDSDRDRDRRRDRRDRGRDREDDQFDGRGDDRRQRRPYDDGRWDSRVRSDERRRTSERYEDENDGRDGRRRDDYDEGRDTFDGDQSDKKSRGFFFGRK